MSEIVRVMCDQCSVTADDAKKADFALSLVLPGGWRSFEQKHFCGYACVIAYCHAQMATASTATPA